MSGVVQPHEFSLNEIVSPSKTVITKALRVVTTTSLKIQLPDHVDIGLNMSLKIPISYYGVKPVNLIEGTLIYSTVIE